MPTLNFSSVAHIIQILVPLLFIVWTLFYFGLARSRYDEVVRGLSNPKTVFVNDFLANEVDGRFDGWGIARLCQRTKWIPDLIMSCAPSSGGVGEVRNAHLNCIRIAIEIGGKSTGWHRMGSDG